MCLTGVTKRVTERFRIIALLKGDIFTNRVYTDIRSPGLDNSNSKELLEWQKASAWSGYLLIDNFLT